MTLLLALYACWTLVASVLGSSLNPPPFRVVQGLKDRQVVERLLFDGPSRSKVHCSSLCSLSPGCDSFTHIPGSSTAASSSCRGHGVVASLGSSVTAEALGARTYSIDPCENYKLLVDDRRDYYSGQSNICDDLEMGWYRFKLENGNNAVMAIFGYIWYYYCGTDIPLVLNLLGQSLPQVDQNIDARACGPEGAWCTSVTVRRCSEGFYIYKMSQPHGCNIAFCTRPQ